MDVILSEVPPNTVDAPQVVLSEVVPRFYTSGLVTDFFYRFAFDPTQAFKFLGSAPVGKTIDVPIELQGLPIVISSVTRQNNNAVKSNPLEGEFYDFTPINNENEITLMASEDLTAGALLNIWDDGGEAKFRHADKASAKHAHAFTTAAALSGAEVVGKFSGLNSGLTGLTIGAPCYLGDDGAVTQTVTSTDTELIQEVGVAQGTSKMMFQPHPTGFIV